MARIRFDVTEFVKEYNEALCAGMRREEIAAYLGVSYQALLYRLKALTKRGIVLSRPIHAKAGKPGRPCPWKGGKAPARRRPRRRKAKEIAVPQPVEDVRIVPASFGFTIIVGG